jgi:hypothetical protein
VSFGLSYGPPLSHFLIEKHTPQLPPERSLRHESWELYVSNFELMSGITQLNKQSLKLIPVNAALGVVIHRIERVLGSLVIKFVSQILHCKMVLIFIDESCTILVECFECIERADLSFWSEAGGVTFGLLYMNHHMKNLEHHTR